IATDMAPINIPQTILCLILGFAIPPVAIPATIWVVESAVVMINIKISAIAKALVISAIGNLDSNSNRATVYSLSTIFAMLSLLVNAILTAVPPKPAIHVKQIKGGIINTPMTNSLIVLPRETRATNPPINGDQEITQAQQKTVHCCIQPLSPVYGLILKLY